MIPLITLFREACKWRHPIGGAAGLFVGLIGSSSLECAATNVVASAAAHETQVLAIAPPQENASYKITLISLSPLKFHVEGDLPVNGKMLDMDQTYPADLPELATNGWPALVSNLIVRDVTGKTVTVRTAGNKGWQLSNPIQSRLKLSYEVDYGLFAASGWSSPLESAFADANDAIIAGRSLFITTTQIGPINLEIVAPEGWMPIMPWRINHGVARHYFIRSKQDLIDNMLVFSTKAPDVVTAAGFNLQIVSMGHWEPLKPLVRKVLAVIISREVDLMHYHEEEIYTVVLIPISDEGGNAFRQSFVYCYNNPDQNNKGVWGNTLAHEIFHYWNYARLKGADYQSSQWFQEGFTEYVANLVIVNGKVINSTEFMNVLGHHVDNYQKLTTTLENYGTHKGPPLYSAGALVAFMWDVKIRKASAGKSNIGDLFRNLMAQTGGGIRKYTWADIRAALQASADGDWEGFYQAYIRGHEPLPLDEILPLAGLRLNKLADGSAQVGLDPAASTEARTLWQELVGG